MKPEKEAFRMNKDHLPCGELMKRIHEAMDAHANSQMQKTGITVTQFKWLVALYETGGGTASLKELERSFRVAPVSYTHLPMPFAQALRRLPDSGSFL